MQPLNSQRLTFASKRQTNLRPNFTAASSSDKPDWLRMLEEDAVDDPEIASLLKGAQDNPDEVQRRMKAEMDALHDRISAEGASGISAPVQVTINPHDPFALWVWIQLYTIPSPTEEEMIQEVIGSWFLLGRLGAFDSGNLQVMYNEGGQGGEVEYESREGLPATMHDLGEVETNGEWMRFWVDLGTADELALDILINSLTTLSSEHVGIRRLVIGGDNDEWPAPEQENPIAAALAASFQLPDDFYEDDDDPEQKANPNRYGI